MREPARRGIRAAIAIVLCIGTFLAIAASGSASAAVHHHPKHHRGHHAKHHSAKSAAHHAADCGSQHVKGTFHGTSPLRDLHRAVPDPLKQIAYPCHFPAGVRAIKVDSTGLYLVAEGRFVRKIALPAHHGAFTLPEIVHLVNNPGWISESHGIVSLFASVIQQPGTTLHIAAPVKTVRLVNNRGVFLGGSHALASIRDVTVTSWDKATAGPVIAATPGRPFVLYENHSRLNLFRSNFNYLGSDQTSSYGVSWRVGGTSGLVNHCVFQNGFFGVYTFHAAHVIFENSIFRNNQVYGIDPHTYSTDIAVRHNNVYGNLDHGIVFSRFVTHSVVADNFVHNNKVNGIMMDYHSDDNVIRGNTVSNNAEGIVFSGSAGGEVYDNKVTGNVVGIRASHDGSNNDNVHNNIVTGGRTGVQLYAGAAAFTLTNNTISGQSSIGMEISAARTTLSDNTVSASPTAIKVESVTAITGGTLSQTKNGIVVTRQGFADITSVANTAVKPLFVDAGGFVNLTSTGFTIPASTHTSVSTLDVVAVSVLIFALLCEMLHVARGWQLRRVSAGWAPARTAGMRYVARPSVARPSGVRQRIVVRPAITGDPAPPPRSAAGEEGTERSGGLRKFRPDIEGLRAIAVVSVVLSHASLGLRGGYVGVDVFFVISGFLITRQLFEEQQRRGRVSFRAFYARRARRILPAATLVTVATLLMAWRWASPLRVVSITKDGIAAALFGVNWRLAAAGTNYFNATAPPSPFQHYWSLSVEEQFYILWPVLLVVISLLFAKRFGRTKPLFAALGVVIVFSLWASIHVTATNAPYAYFGTHTRAWELALGAVVGIGAHDLHRIPRRVATGLAWGGIAAIVAACFVLSSNTPYPGDAALLPVLGAVAVIVAGCGAATKWGPENAFLKRRLMQGGGKVSYSLYLWHWPLLILIPDALGHALGTGQRFIVVGAALGLSILTFVFVEEPIRRKRSLVLQPRKAAMLGGALVATSVVVALIVGSAISVPGSNEPATNARQAAAINQLTAGSTTQTPAQLTAQLTSAAALTTLPANVTPSLAQAPTDAPNTKGCQVTQNVTTPKLPCNSFGDIHSKTQVVLIGDSHAGMWLDAINAIALAQHWRLTALMKSGCSVANYPTLLSPISNQVFTQCNAWRPKMIADVKAIHPALIIIGSEARDIAATDPSGLTSSINALKATGTKVAFLADTPSPRSVGDIPDCLSTHLHDIQTCGIQRVNAGLTDSGRVAEIQGAQSAGATVIDPTSWMCTQLTCPAVIQNEIVYQDDSHITDSFALLRERPLGLALTAVMKG